VHSDTHTHTRTHTYGSFLQLTNGLGLHLAKGCGYIATICLVVSISMGLVASVDKPSPTNQQPVAFNALTWLVRHQEEHLACKNDWWGDGGFLPSQVVAYMVKVVICWKWCKIETLLLQITSRKWYMSIKQWHNSDYLKWPSRSYLIKAF